MDILLVRKNVKFKMPTGESGEIPCLLPAFTHQYEAIRKLPMGRVIDCKAKISRNNKLNQKYHALINYVYDNLDSSLYDFKNIGQFEEWIKFEVGFTEVYTVNGKVRAYARSSAFSNCDEVTFENELYNPAMFLFSKILGMTIDEIETASLEYDGPDYKHSGGR